MSNWAALQATLDKKGKGAGRVQPASAHRPTMGSAPSHQHRKPKKLPEGTIGDGGSFAELPLTDDAPASLDERVRTASDVLVQLPASASVGAVASAPWLEAARLNAVRQLGDLFRERCDALGGRKHYAHFETWLWAARAEAASSTQSGGHGGCGVVPPIPPRPSLAARGELTRKLVRAGVHEDGARSICEELEALCTRLCAQLDASVEQAATAAEPLRKPAKAKGPVPTARGASMVVRVLPAHAEDKGAEAAASKPESAKARRKRKRPEAEGRASELAGGGGGEADDPVPRVRLAYGETELLVTERHLTKLHALYCIATGGGGGGDGGGGGEKGGGNGGGEGRRDGSGGSGGSGGSRAAVEHQQQHQRQHRQQHEQPHSQSGVGHEAAVERAVLDGAFLEAAFCVLARYHGMHALYTCTPTRAYLHVHIIPTRACISYLHVQLCRVGTTVPAGCRARARQPSLMRSGMI